MCDVRWWSPVRGGSPGPGPPPPPRRGVSRPANQAGVLGLAGTPPQPPRPCGSLALSTPAAGYTLGLHERYRAHLTPGFTSGRGPRHPPQAPRPMPRRPVHAMVRRRALAAAGLLPGRGRETGLGVMAGGGVRFPVLEVPGLEGSPCLGSSLSWSACRRAGGMSPRGVWCSPAPLGRRTPAAPRPAFGWVGLREQAQAHPLAACCDLRRAVQPSARHCCPADRGETHKFTTLGHDLEMLLPLVLAGMKQADNGLTLGLIAADVSGLIQIAGTAGQCPVRRGLGTATGDRHKVLDFQ